MRKGLPVVQQGESIEDWLTRAVPALVEQAQVDEVTAKQLATEAWQAVNGEGEQPEGDPSGQEGWPDDESEGEDSFAVGAEKKPKVETEGEDSDPEKDKKPSQKEPPAPVKGEDGEDSFDADEDEEDEDAFAADEDEEADAEGEVPPDAMKGEEDDLLADDDEEKPKGKPEAETEAAGPAEWDDEDTWGESLLDQPDSAGKPKADEGAAPADGKKPAEGKEPKPLKPVLASGELLTWFHEQMVNAGDMIAQALVGNGNVKQDEADLLKNEMRRLLDKLLPAPTAAPGSAVKASTIITYLESMIHRDFTNLADTLREQGNLTRSERIALSGCVGAMLSTFIDSVRQNLGPEFMTRPTFTDIEQFRSEDRSGNGSEQAKPQAATGNLAGKPNTGTPAARPSAGETGKPQTDETPATKDEMVTPAAPLGSAPGELTLTITLPPVEPDLYTKGFTYALTGDGESGGFAVLPVPERGRVLIADDMTAKTIADFVTTNTDMWQIEGASLGGWQDQQKGIVRLDVALRTATETEAIELARRYEQSHYLNLSTGKAIPVPEQTKSAALDLETLRSIWIATKGFIGPSYRARYRLDDDPVDLLAVKAIGKNRAGGYLCLWGDQAHKDLSGEFFTPNTAELTSIFEAMGGVPAMYHHAFDDVLKSLVVGVIDVMKKDDVGLWVEDQIRMADEYQKYIQPLVAKRKLGWSSGTLPGARRVRKDTGEILRWPIVEGSKTYSPAEWRMVAQWPIELLTSTYTTAGLNTGKFSTLLSGSLVPDQLLAGELERLDKIGRK